MIKLCRLIICQIVIFFDLMENLGVGVVGAQHPTDAESIMVLVGCCPPDNTKYQNQKIIFLTISPASHL